MTSASTPLTPDTVLGAVATNAGCTRNGVGAYHSAIRIVATSWAATGSGLRDNKANSTTLDVLVRRTRNDGTAPEPIAPGTYQVGRRTGDVVAELRVVKKDGRCGPGADPVASQGMGVSGTVTVTRVSPTLDGAVNALDNGARVIGTFSVAPRVTSPGDACDVATLDPTSPGACVP